MVAEAASEWLAIGVYGGVGGGEERREKDEEEEEGGGSNWELELGSHF